MASVKAELNKALAALNVAVEKYARAAVAAGREAPDGPTCRGFDSNQLQKKLTSHIVAALSPRPSHGVRPFLRFDGAPECRKYAAAHPLPEL